MNSCRRRNRWMWVGGLGGLGLAVILLQRFRKPGQARQPRDQVPNQTAYRLYAPIYDALFGPFYASARRRAAQLLALQPGEKLLI